MTERARSRLHRPPSSTAAPHNWLAAMLSSRSDVAAWLIVTLSALMVLIWILTTVPPDGIASVILPNDFLPLQLVTLFFSSSLAIFLERHIRRGILTGIWLQSLIFLHLQHVQLSWQLSGVLLISFVIMELGFIYLENRPSHPRHATPHRSRHPLTTAATTQSSLGQAPS